MGFNLENIKVTNNFSLSGGTLDLAGTVAPSVVNAGTLEINGTPFTGVVVGGSHTITAGETTAGSATIATGLGTIITEVVEVIDSNVFETGFSLTTSGANLIIGNNGTAFTLGTTDIVNWIAIGTT